MAVILRNVVLRLAKDNVTKGLWIWQHSKNQMHSSFAALEMTAEFCGASLRWAGGAPAPTRAFAAHLLDLDYALPGVGFDFIHAGYDFTGELVERFAG